MYCDIVVTKPFDQVFTYKTNDRSIKSEFDANLLEKIIEVSLIKKNMDIDFELSLIHI